MSQEVLYVRLNSLNTVSYSLPDYTWRTYNKLLVRSSSNPTHELGRSTLHEAYCVLFLRSYLIREEPSARSALNFFPTPDLQSSLFNCIRLYLIQNRPCRRGFPLESRPLLSLSSLLASLPELYYIPRFKLRFVRQSYRDGRP